MQQVGVPPALDALGEGVDDCSCDGGSIRGGGPSAQLVQRHEAGTGGAVQRRGRLNQLHKERALPESHTSLNMTSTHHHCKDKEEGRAKLAPREWSAP